MNIVNERVMRQYANRATPGRKKGQLCYTTPVYRDTYEIHPGQEHAADVELVKAITPIAALDAAEDRSPVPAGDVSAYECDIRYLVDGEVRYEATVRNLSSSEYIKICMADGGLRNALAKIGTIGSTGPGGA